MSILNKHKNASLVFAVVAIILVIAFNVYMYVIGPSLQARSTPPATQTSADGVDESVVQQANAANREFSWLPIIISLVILGAGTIGIVVAVNWFDGQRQARDRRRQSDLQTLAQAFVAYKQAIGHFPISSTYQAKYYTGINLSNDWHYYGLPTDDQMRQYLPNWPVSDPSISYSSHDQTNQYIYYPRNNGQDFDLYAHLETAASQSPNYNQMDGLLQAWGQYNFKVSSQSLPVPANKEQLAQDERPEVKIEGNGAAQNPNPSLTSNPQTANNQPHLPEDGQALAETASQPDPTINSQPMPPATPPASETPSQPVAPQPSMMQPPLAAPQPTINYQQPATPIDTSVQPAALQSAAQADLQEQVDEQGEISHINQLLQDVDASIITSRPIAPTPPPPAALPADELPTPAPPPTNPSPVGSNTLSQLDRFSQAIAIQSEKADSATPPPPAQLPAANPTDPPPASPATR